MLVFAINSLLILPKAACSQTVNAGELYVVSGTVFSSLGAFNNLNTATYINNGESHFYNHFTNDGVVDFLDDVNSSVHFESQFLQKISGNSPSYFNNVFFNNSSGLATSFEVSNDLKIENEANFYSGILNNKDFGGTVTFGANATQINTSNNSYVNGSVNKIGNTPFDFPIGDNGFFRPAKISAPEEISEEIKSTYIQENSNMLYSHSLKEGILKYIDENEYWEIRQETDATNVVVTLTWDENTTSSEIINTDSKTSINIARWDEIKGYWVNERGIVDVDNKSVTTVSKFSGYGVFALSLIKENLSLPNGCLTVYNGISNNNDGKNDALTITCIDDYSNNTVEIFNRWGRKVFETKRYTNQDNNFKGNSKGKKLPSGTYFYVLKYKLNNKEYRKIGSLYVN